MKISDLIEHLTKIKNKDGDLNVCMTEPDEYWGTLYYHIDKNSVLVSDHAQPEGPKSGVSERAVILTH